MCDVTMLSRIILVWNWQTFRTILWLVHNHKQSNHRAVVLTHNYDDSERPFVIHAPQVAAADGLIPNKARWYEETNLSPLHLTLRHSCSPAVSAALLYIILPFAEGHRAVEWLVQFSGRPVLTYHFKNTRARWRYAPSSSFSSLRRAQWCRKSSEKSSRCNILPRQFLPARIHSGSDWRRLHLLT